MALTDVRACLSGRKGAIRVRTIFRSLLPIKWLVHWKTRVNQAMTEQDADAIRQGAPTQSTARSFSFNLNYPQPRSKPERATSKYKQRVLTP
ncbi:hypothetical protein DTL21_09335 [Bremerella cremea]|uniref:Uncharacterized protein n=1 Tax=Blastopirellula marina TaxID=124 RepID=A0A2S8FV98_9BACT|nr:hypothetical protein C5Y83_09330 [Blastopirellula marina]RCS48788.1 hypothetical protein DTL21_09335 [Bremerella cremea]